MGTDLAATLERDIASEQPVGGAGHGCRFCGAALNRTFVNLGVSPLCESFRTPEELNRMEAFYPLHVYVCEECLLVQLQEYAGPEEIFTEYAYFSSFSDSWLNHCKSYCYAMAERFGLGAGSHVVEVASNDGYLLQYFVEQKIPVLGVEPAVNVAKTAVARGVPTRVDFFGTRLAHELVAEGKSADLIAGNNVLAQVPDLNDFVEGLKILLKPAGVLTLEFPHLQTLIELNEFDTIYHEHFSYFSFYTTDRIMRAHGLRIFDVEEIPTHGGSLRIYACRAEDTTHAVSERVLALHEKENQGGLTDLRTYDRYAEQVKRTKWALLDLLIQAKKEGKRIAGYGAPGKGTTLLMYCGVGTDFLDFTVDRNPYKHGRFMPGSHIPIFPPEKLAEEKPDYILILPWNLKDEIIKQLQYTREWGAQFIVPIPEPAIY